MRRLQRVVVSPQIGLRVKRDYLWFWKGRRKRRLQELKVIDVGCRNRIDALDSRQVLRAGFTKCAARILESDGVAVGADLIEAVDELETRAFLHQADTR